MKKTIILSLVFLFNIVSVQAILITPETIQTRKTEIQENSANIETSAEIEEVKAQIQENPGQIASEIIYQNKEQTIIKIDKFIQILGEIEKAVSVSPATEESKTAANDAINALINILEETKQELNQAESAADIQAIILESTEELRMIKAEVKAELENLKAEIQSISAEEIEAAIDDIEEILRLLKIVCPGQKEAIATIENDLDELEALLIEINNYIQTEEYQKASEAIMESNELILEVGIAIKTISEECLY